MPFSSEKPPPKMTRFVVLRHQQDQGSHYDIMIETGATLATWKCTPPPTEARSTPVPCIRIGDHRLMYLEYEGPVSGNRGIVARHDHGKCQILEWGDRSVELIFEGTALRGHYALRLEDEASQSWCLAALDG